MSELTLTPTVMRAFHEEMAKVAAVPGEILKHLGRVGTRKAIGAGVGGGAGIGLAAGGALGGIKGGREAYSDARAHGASIPGAAISALGGGLGGAARGAAKGALVGAGVGGLVGAGLPTETLSATRRLQKLDNSLGSFHNFGQRQVHSLTGWKPGGAHKSVERIGAGAAAPRRELAAELSKGVGRPDVVERGARALGAAEKAQGMGLTSLPGIASSVKNNGLFPTVGAAARSQWESSGWKGKALMAGLPAMSAAQALRAPEGEGGSGRGERIGRIIGGTVGGLAPLPIAGSIALAAGLERAGGVAGRGVDKLRKHPPQVRQDPERPAATEPRESGQQAVEHVYGTGFNGGGLE